MTLYLFDLRIILSKLSGWRLESNTKDNGMVLFGDHLDAANKVGYKDTYTLRNQACKFRRECAEEITEELHRNFAEIAPRALNIPN